MEALDLFVSPIKIGIRIAVGQRAISNPIMLIPKRYLLPITNFPLAKVFYIAGKTGDVLPGALEEYFLKGDGHW